MARRISVDAAIPGEGACADGLASPPAGESAGSFQG